MERLDEVTRDCLGCPETAIASESNDTAASTWIRLFKEPHKACPVDARALGISEETKVDLVFRVAILAAIQKLNAGRVQEVVAQTFSASEARNVPTTVGFADGLDGPSTRRDEDVR